MGEHIIPALYNTVYNMKQALEGGEEGYLMKDTHVYKRKKLNCTVCLYLFS